MHHPDEGALRRLLDEPDDVSDADRDHVRTCARCRQVTADMRADADRVHAALVVGTDTHVDVDAAWQRFQGPTATPVATVTPLRRPGRVRTALRRPAVAGIAVAVIITGAGTAAANDWFDIFEAQRVQPIALSPGAILDALPDLAEYGEVTFDGAPHLRSVDSATEAAAETGLDVPVVADLPRGVTGSPSYEVGDAVTVTFTYDEDLGGDAPDGLDGSSVRLTAGPGVAEVWRQDGGIPVLLVGRATAPTAQSTSGVPFDAMRDHLLSLDLPEEVAASLRSFNADGSTFPLPIPVDGMRSSTVDVDGSEATLITSSDETIAAVAWVDDGVVTVVGGALDADEVLDVARELA